MLTAGSFPQHVCRALDDVYYEYAQALLEIGQERECLDRVRSDIKLLLEAMNQNQVGPTGGNIRT